MTSWWGREARSRGLGRADGDEGVSAMHMLAGLYDSAWFEALSSVAERLCRPCGAWGARRPVSARQGRLAPPGPEP
jgi:hypothetical protein